MYTWPSETLIGNTLIDSLVSRWYSQDFDKNGEIVSVLAKLHDDSVDYRPGISTAGSQGNGVWRTS